METSKKEKPEQQRVIRPFWLHRHLLTLKREEAALSEEIETKLWEFLEAAAQGVPSVAEKDRIWTHIQKLVLRQQVLRWELAACRKTLLR